MRRTLRITLAAALIGLAWLFGGAGGIVTLALFVAGAFAGLPLGFALFGSGQAAGWIAGALLGYAQLSIAFWAVVRFGDPRPVAFAVAWLVVLLTGSAIRRYARGPLVVLPPWTRRDGAALLLVLHLVPLLVASPFARTGERDEAGTRYYRAYFTADFVWHMALTREVARFEPELRNPYLSDEPLHYYWTYFLPAAVFATRGEPGRGDVVAWSSEQGTQDPIESGLKITAMMAAVLLLAMVYLAAWSACGRWRAAVAASAIAVVAASFEGLYALNQLLQAGQPLDALRDLNIDAMSRWAASIQGLRIDNLPRTFWWTPQHGMSCALGLIAMVVAARAPGAGLAPILYSGLALGLSVTFNPLLGAVFSAVYGLTALGDVLARRINLIGLGRHALAAIPVGAALWWCDAAGMSEGANAVSFGLHPFARTAPFTALAVSLGGVLIPAVIGAWPSRAMPLRHAAPALWAVSLGLILMHFVTITESSWLGFRAGNVILVTVAMLIARGLVTLSARFGKPVAAAFAGLLLLGGSPTTAIDWYNARDLENRRMGPGFLWVIPYSADQQAGFDWVRRATTPDAVVQFDPIVRARQDWSSVPTFTGRRMAAAMPISLLPEPRHEEMSRRVHAVFTSLPPDAAHADARAMGIDYLWIDEEDRAAPTAAAVERLLERPDLFPPVFERGHTLVLAVAR